MILKKTFGFFSIILFISLVFFGYAFADVREPSLLQQTSDFISNPFISALILAIGFTGLLKEMMIEEKKFIGGTIAFIALGSFFGIKFLAGSLDFLGLGLIILGLLLVIIEIFLIPGLGLPGIIGTIMLFIGILRFCNNNLEEALILSCLVFVFVFAFTFGVVKAMGTKLKINGWSISSEQTYTKDGSVEEENPQPELSVGLVGTTTTGLKPGGKAKFIVVGFDDEVTSDVVAEKNSFIDINKKVEIIDISANRIVVKEIIEGDK